MIRLDRGISPKFFDSDRYMELLEGLFVDFEDIEALNQQKRYPFRSVSVLIEKIKPELLQRFQGKCAYCESHVGDLQEAAVNHYRPKAGARGFAEGAEKATKNSVYHEHLYWWLALQWDNLLIVCQSCNRFKASWFPLEDEAQRAMAPDPSGPSLDKESPLLLDPCSDDPSAHLHFLEDGRAAALSNRGRATIDIINLNRKDLVEARLRAKKALRTMFEQFDVDSKFASNAKFKWMAEFSDSTSFSTREYLAIQRQFLKTWVAEEQDDAVRESLSLSVEGESVEGEPVEDDSELPDDAFSAIPFSVQSRGTRSAGVPEPTAVDVPIDVQPLDLGRIAIEKIKLFNFKSIADLTLELPIRGAGAPWLMFLGENAVGKTSIMQAIVLTLMGENNCNGIQSLNPGDVLRRFREQGELVQAEEGWVKIWVSGREEPVTLSFEKGNAKFQSNSPGPQTYLLAYGSTRLFPEPENETPVSPGKVRVQNLFKASTPLVDAGAWLINLHETDSDQFHRVARALRELLLLKPDEQIRPDRSDTGKKRILIDLGNGATPLSGLSDGYRAIVALSCDLMYMLAREGTSMEEAEGVVLIDEIGTNLHPRWKKRIVSCFRNVFPRIQFIVSTHEPLCLKGLYKGETVLLRRDKDDLVVPITNLPDPNALRVDQILVSEFFGLSSTLDSEMEDVYDEYYELLILKSRTGDQEARMAALKEKLRDHEHLGHGLRDELMYEVIDKLLAEHLRSRKPKARRALKEEAIDKVLAAWKEAGIYEDDQEAS